MFAATHIAVLLHLRLCVPDFVAVLKNSIQEQDLMMEVFVKSQCQRVQSQVLHKISQIFTARPAQVSISRCHRHELVELGLTSGKDLVGW